jgi:hypothetical protein
MIATTVENMAIKYLDVFEYVKGSKKIQDPGDLAEYQAKQIESAIETAVQYVKSDHAGLATKGDIQTVKAEIQTVRGEIQTVRGELQTVKGELQNEIRAVKDDIKDLRYDTLKFVVWTGSAVLLAMTAMLARGFHWF